MGKKLWIGIGIVFLLALVVGGIYFVSQADLSQSVLSLSSVNVGDDGKVYWLFTASVNNLDEKVTFTYRTPDKYVKNDGTEITPTEGMSVSLSKRKNLCEYRATKQTITRYLFWTYEYYTLNNPERTALIEVRDGNGNNVVMDATVVDSEVMTDSDGKGKITIQTQGFLGGKVDCPDYDNVAIYYDNDGELQIKDKFQLENKIYDISIFGNLFDLISTVTRTVNTNTAFINSFEDIDFDGNKFTGDLDFGNGVITITADQEYFDSTIYTPPAEVDPRIKDINYPDEIIQDGTGTMTVKIDNRKDSEGTVKVEATSSYFTINPSSKNVLLEDEATVQFNLKASNTLKDNAKINVEVCSTNQFGDKNCDEDDVSIDIVENDPDKLCGDGICQVDIGETETNCPDDCLHDNIELCGDEIDNDGDGLVDYNDPDCIKAKCGAWIKIGGVTILPDLWCHLNNFVFKFRLTLSIVLGALTGLLSWLFSRKWAVDFSLVKQSELKKYWWIPLSIGALLGLAVGFLAFYYFWIGLLVLIVIAIIKIFI